MQYVFAVSKALRRFSETDEPQYIVSIYGYGYDAVSEDQLTDDMEIIREIK